MLVVRVKRKRDELPADKICVVEDSGNQLASKKRKGAGLAAQFSELLSVDAAGAEAAQQQQQLHGHQPNDDASKQIVLHRLKTLSSGSRAHLDEATMLALTEGDAAFACEEVGEALERPASKRSKLMVTQNRSRLTLQGQQACVVVDMLQVITEDQSKAPNAIPLSTANPANPATPIRILDPATRELDRGILLAIQKGDFNLISSALIQGANPNHQQPLEKGGYTALMAASMKCNVRMVKRLLLADVDPSVLNQRQQTALDLVRDTSQNHSEAQEVRLLLQSALIKLYQSKASARNQRGSNREQRLGAAGIEDYVVDIYCIRQPGDELAASAAATTADAMHVDEADQVHIEGLRILEGGQVELLLYDSDWSDMADDEDPDSNDERFEGNDYPEEEDSAEEQVYDEDEDSEDEDRTHFRQQQANVRHAVQNAHGDAKSHPTASLYDNIAFGDEDDDIPLFERAQRIGKVLHPTLLDEGQAVYRGQDTESLQQLWGQQPVPAADNSQQQRIQAMRERTGMVFAANPSEFQENGLAKYGMELSDDEEDEEVLYQSAYGSSNAHIHSSTVAYDAELDEDEYDQG